MYIYIYTYIHTYIHTHTYFKTFATKSMDMSHCMGVSLCCPISVSPVTEVSCCWPLFF